MAGGSIGTHCTFSPAIPNHMHFSAFHRIEWPREMGQRNLIGKKIGCRGSLQRVDTAIVDFYLNLLLP